MKLNSKVESKYFVTLLNTNYFKRLFQIRCKKAVNQANISPTLLREFKLMVPPIDMQKDFGKIYDKAEKLKYKLKESERQSEMLFQSLLYRAFSGELSKKDEKVLAEV